MQQIKANDCILEEEINWEVSLIRDELNRDQEMIPDWQGYWRIDKD